jgi:formate dehydrogenase subunit gamma
MQHEVERYRRETRILHWLIAISFSLLFLTGLVLFVPALGFLAQDSWTRVIHRIMAVVFVVAPLHYMLTNWKASWHGIKEAFTWGMDDIGWLLAAPRYYFLCDESRMPPQEHINTGQKMWWLMVLLCSLGFTGTGFVMWFLKPIVPDVFFQWMVVLHDLLFIATAPMFFVHVYLSCFHPLMGPASEGAWSSMARGKVSVHYAQSHHGKWYARVVARAGRKIAK